MISIDASASRPVRAAASVMMLAVTLTAVGFVRPAAGNEPTNASDVIRAVAGGTSADRIERDMRALVGFGTRHTLSETDSDTRGIGAARRWVKAQFDRMSGECGGCLTVYFEEDTISGEGRIPGPTEVVNVIAVQRGTTDPDRHVIMSADIDSRVTDVMNYRSDAPGADDNASGLAGVLEAARVLSQHRFPASIVYAALSAEEQGLFGGRIMAAAARRDGWFVEGVLNNDMIGNIEGIGGQIDNGSARVFSEGTRATETEAEARDRRYRGGEVDSASRNLARYVHRIADRYIDNLDVMMIYRLDRFGRGGHHVPFNDAGFPAVRIMETYENYNRQHQDVRVENGVHYGDTIDFVNFAYAAKLTSLNIATLASLALAPAPPQEVTLSGAVSANTTLRWKRVPGASGYRIYWRLTTSPVWTHSRDAGNVEEVTLHDMVIDNYFFGVAAMSADGAESPVVFPGPAGAFRVMQNTGSDH